MDLNLILCTAYIAYPSLALSMELIKRHPGRHMAVKCEASIQADPVPLCLGLWIAALSFVALYLVPGLYEY